MGSSKSIVAPRSDILLHGLLCQITVRLGSCMAVHVLDNAVVLLLMG